MARWIFILFPLCGVLYAEASQLTSVECCLRGRLRGMERASCLALPQISSNEHCSMIQEKCCKAFLIHKHCVSGIVMYREQGVCEKPYFHGDPWEIHISKTCCDCCGLGIKEGELSSNCELKGLTLSWQCAETARMCCRNGTSEETELEHRDPVTEKPDVTAATRPQGRNQSCGDSVCEHLCVGNGTCACINGYQLQKDGRSCEDINECQNGSHYCATGQVCVNTLGSFRCRREKRCGVGYELRDNSCQDINECALGTHNCGPDFVCNNIRGSFRCVPNDKCQGGFIADDIGSCIDINECVTNTSLCSPSQMCVNTIGSYACSRNTVNCGRGFHLTDDGSRCEDVDECRQGNTCGDHGCLNLVGSFRCHCRQGFTFDTINRCCEDINECLNYHGRQCAHNCKNTEGSFQCICDSGFKLSQDKRSCEDIDECEASPCQHECINTYGSYYCYCRPGYTLSEIDGKSCNDVDECSPQTEHDAPQTDNHVLQTNKHLCAYRCSNTDGSYHCTCPPTGYVLAPDGRTCQDIDECRVGTHNCPANESCFNFQGGFRCLSYKCPHNYREIEKRADPPLNLRCSRTCQPNDQSCLAVPVLLISHINIALPTFSVFNGPEDLVFLRTNMLAEQNPDAGFAYVKFLIKVKRQFQFCFDVQMRSYDGYIMGVVRQLSPVTGPTSIDLDVKIEYMKYGLRTHSSQVFIHVIVSEFSF